MAPLYRPTKIELHNKTLARFVRMFNEVEPKSIRAVEESEKYIRDGYIILAKIIGFDWEVREDWVCQSGQFLYSELAQFERKFDPNKKIDLAIQCDSNLQWLVLAWHKHFKKSLPVTRKTDFHLKEHGEMRLTDKYQVFHWTEFAKIKAWILNGA